MITIGDHTIIPVVDSVVRNPPTRMFPTTWPAAPDAYAQYLGPDGLLEMFMGGYVLRSGDRLVLIDTGVGPDGWNTPSGAQMPGGHLIDNLRAVGLEPDAFTDVLCTHLHRDHVGWTSLHGRPVFPNATYRCHRADWRYFVEEERDGHFSAPELLTPIESRFEMWDGSRTLFPGVDVVAAPGHTPGSSIVVVSADSGERAMLLGDVVHCPVELVDEELETIGDVDPVLGKATRDRLARELEDTSTHIAAAHFPGLEFGRLLHGEPKRRWLPLS